MYYNCIIIARPLDPTMTSSLLPFSEDDPTTASRNIRTLIMLRHCLLVAPGLADALEASESLFVVRHRHDDGGVTV